MSDNPATPEDTADPSAETQNTDTAAGEAQENRVPQSRFREVVQQKNDLATRLAELETREKEREQQESIAQGKHEDVIAELREELKATRATLEASQGYRDALMASVQKRVESIPETQRSLVPGFEDPVKLADWLDSNQHLLTSPAPPPTDAGVSGDRAPKQTKLTPEEQKTARIFGMTDEEYLRGKLGAEADVAARENLPPNLTT